MFLAIDIGNTNVTLGIFKGNTLGPCWRLASGKSKMPDEFGAVIISLIKNAGIDPSSLKKVAMASVVPPLTSVFVEVCRRYLNCEPLVIEGASHAGIRVLCDHPEQVGADRIVDAVAGYRLYGGPACIIDFGTATTFNALTSKGEYLGGAITADLEISAEALFQKAL